MSGQTVKRQALTQADYHLWSKLSPGKLSPGGSWASYDLRYDSGEDTLFVVHTGSLKTYRFAKGYAGSFNGEHHFSCLDDKGELQVLDLRTGNRQLFSGVGRHLWSANQKYLVMECRDTMEGTHLSVRNLQGKELLRIAGITSWSASPQENGIAYTTADGSINSCGLLLLEDQVSIKMVLPSTSRSVKLPFWQPNGASFGFIEEGTGDELGRVSHFRLKDAKLRIFIASDNILFDKSYCINGDFADFPSIATDGRTVFFGIRKKRDSLPVLDPMAVKIWNTEDSWNFPTKASLDGWHNINMLAAWWPDTGRYQQLADEVLPKITITADAKHTISYNPKAYEPQFQYNGNVDYYITELETMVRKLLLANHSGNDRSIILSPQGKYITYFKEDHWWLYTILTGNHRMLGKDITTPLSDIEHDMREEAPPYGFAGWTEGEESLLVYDEFDLWELPLEKDKAVRLTNGREKQISYRLDAASRKKRFRRIYDGEQSGAFDLGTLNLIQGRNKSNGSSGYYSLKRETGLRKLVEGEKEIGQAVVEGGSILYIEQRYDQAPSLWHTEWKLGKMKKLFQSNEQHRLYFWGRSKLVSYRTSKGLTLKGKLYYPANFDPTQKYPLLVHVYQKQEVNLHRYINPTVYNGTGFNISNFTTRGYFVLLPDIRYEVGNIGLSALDCVSSAVDEVIKTEAIDATKIGLNGHSLGGYESLFFITQSNLFAAACAGSGISDLTSFYYGTGWNYSRPEIWRFEYQSMRMGQPPYDDFEGYSRNSPLAQVAKVETPLLSWTGKNDGVVDYSQSIAFYNAMRRLGKRHSFLVYPDETHVLVQREHSKDLTMRIEQWFDHYLKGQPEPSWSKRDHNH